MVAACGGGVGGVRKVLPTCGGERLSRGGGGSCLLVRAEERRRRLACWGASMVGAFCINLCCAVVTCGRLDKAQSGGVRAGGRRTTFSVFEEMTRIGEEK